MTNPEVAPLRLLFLAPMAEDARCAKRARSLHAAGADVRTLAFARLAGDGPPAAEAFEILANIRHGHYGRRLVTFARALPRIRAAARDADVIYAAGLDLALLAWAANRSVGAPARLVCEMADVLDVFLGDGARARALRAAERFLLGTCTTVVTTSPAAAEHYFEAIQGISAARMFLLENKLERGALPAAKSRVSERDGPIRIGYFGLLRCERSWRLLRRVAIESRGAIEVELRGLVTELPQLEAEARRTPGVRFGGHYRSPEDLPALFDDVDVVWAAHKNSVAAARWARGNRFYEACAFGRPLIVQRDTPDGDAVRAAGLGIEVELDEPEAAARQILALRRPDLAVYEANLRALPAEVYLCGQEHDQLVERLRSAD